MTSLLSVWRSGAQTVSLRSSVWRWSVVSEPNRVLLCLAVLNRNMLLSDETPGISRLLSGSRCKTCTSDEAVPRENRLHVDEALLAGNRSSRRERSGNPRRRLNTNDLPIKSELPIDFVKVEFPVKND